MTYFNHRRAIMRWLILFCVFILANAGYAQCAGTDSTVTVCEKDTDISTRDYDLFAQLAGSPSAGGTWSTNDPGNFFALDSSTGEVDLWRITNSGVHTFTYTNDVCGESAVVTVNLGGYPGENNVDGSANACSDDPSVNLHGFLGSEIDGKVQDFNGVWAEDPSTATGFLTQNRFNAEEAGPGVYLFTYTVSSVDTCPERIARVELEVHASPESGEAEVLTFCATDDFSGLTNVNLRDLLDGEDDNGTWSETTTDQISSLTDSFIDVQEIYDNFGYGIYPFTYTVLSSHPICEQSSSTVSVIIQPVLNGVMATVNHCPEPDTYNIDITTYDTDLIGAGVYQASYSINSVRIRDAEDLRLRPDGTGFLRIDADVVPINQPTTLEIVSLGAGVCDDIQVAPMTFIVTDPSAEVTDSCEMADVPVALSNIFDASENRANGSFEVSYTLTAPSGTETMHTLNDVAFSSENTSFTIPADQIDETGAYEINFEIIGALSVACDIADTVTITAIPPAIDLSLLVDNNCNATQIDVMVDAPDLANGRYVITYDVTRQDTGEVVIDNTINFAGGTASYDLDVASLEQGNYTVSVRSTQDDTTLCRTEFDFEESENFAIEGVPALPEAEAEQTFCLSAFAPDAPTLADIAVTANGEMMFYATATDMDILPLDTALVDGEDYFISNIDPNNNCEGSDRIQVTVSLADPQRPTASNAHPTFCDSENPVVADLDASIDGETNVAWFETESGGTALEDDVALIDGQSYYAATENGGRCLSSQRLQIVPNVYALEPASLQFANLALCGLDNPTIGDLRDAEGDNPFEVLWYDTAENGTPLPDAFLLTNNTVYFAESFNPDTGCMNPERMAIMVDLTECEPEDYGFFIPDGFSPNGDGRNDTFFIPNIEVIFPDFTLEILNRYGSTLFKGDIGRPAWDGSNGSGTAPNGVYFYIINYNKEGHEPIQGRLYLNR